MMRKTDKDGVLWQQRSRKSIDHSALLRDILMRMRGTCAVGACLPSRCDVVVVKWWDWFSALL
jgi:hypothetical protein